jgi:hypothetical protein
MSALLVTALLASSPAAAQQPPTSSPAAAASSGADAKPAPALPVSLDRIRDGLDRPADGLLLKAFQKEPTFRVQIQERQSIEDLLATLNFKTGPTPAEGIYGFEQQRMMVPSVDNPLAQPYAAFSQGQLMTILVQNLVGRYLAKPIASAVTRAVREHAEAAARKEVQDAIDQYCAGKPNQGAGVGLCDTPASTSNR